jgi:regulator of sigma D
VAEIFFTNSQALSDIGEQVEVRVVLKDYEGKWVSFEAAKLT